MAMGQKEAVIAEVLIHLPNFVKGKDNAILLLSNQQLEIIKSTIYGSIITGVIEYSKDKTNLAEVRTYARSMVMNHLKKAKELNGGAVLVTSSSTSDPTPRTVRVKEVRGPKGVNLDLLPPELAEFAKTLV